MAATWIKPIKINKGKSIAQTIHQKTSYITNPEKISKEAIYTIEKTFRITSGSGITVNINK